MKVYVVHYMTVPWGEYPRFPIGVYTDRAVADVVRMEYGPGKVTVSEYLLDAFAEEFLAGKRPYGVFLDKDGKMVMAVCQELLSGQWEFKWGIHNVYYDNGDLKGMSWVGMSGSLEEAVETAKTAFQECRKEDDNA